MPRLAIIDNLTNKVVNVAVADEINQIDGMTCVFSEIADIGDTYENDTFIKPIIEQSQEALIKNQIIQLELSMTPRRLREAVLTQGGKTWLQDIENQIAALRAQL